MLSSTEFIKYLPIFWSIPIKHFPKEYRKKWHILTIMDLQLNSPIKKRGRKKKDDNIQMIMEDEKDDISNKKRGRKPKGGKIITVTDSNGSNDQQLVNVILHLKCSLKDLEQYNEELKAQITNPLEYKPIIPPTIETYNENDYGLSLYQKEIKEKMDELVNIEKQYAYIDSGGCLKCQSHKIETDVCIETNESDEIDKLNIKDINQRLKKLRIQYYKNTLYDKKSACFWCTYEFDNEPCYIPKYEMDSNICGYGSFCRPECAVGYLMKESIDDSTKFERYHLLNQIYSKVYGYKKNIKPAPNPYYLLEKYYGSLTIQEYRKLLKTEHMLLVIDKPMTRILPELHEDNDDFIVNLYGTSKPDSTITNQLSGGVYKVKRQSEKGTKEDKKAAIRNNFGTSVISS